MFRNKIKIFLPLEKKSAAKERLKMLGHKVAFEAHQPDMDLLEDAGGKLPPVSFPPVPLMCGNDTGGKFAAGVNDAGGK
jgi:hypothetical protein